MNRGLPFSSSRPVRNPDFQFFLQGFRTGARILLPGAILFCAGAAFADTNNPPATSLALPDTSLTLIRIVGALALVLGLFLGGVWLFKNWQRLSVQRGRQPRLNILETRSLGGRQAVFVVAYDRQRFLVATSPAGVNFLSHLPDAETGPEEPVEKPGGPMPFGQALAQVLRRK